MYLLFSFAQLLLTNVSRWPTNSNAYALLYFVVEPIFWILNFLVALEILRLILGDFPAIAAVAESMLKWGLPLAALIAAGSGIVSLSHQGGAYALLRGFFVVERTVLFSLLLVLILIQLLCRRYRLPLPHNTHVYSTVFTVYFAIKVMGFLVVSELGVSKHVAVTSSALIASNALALLYLSFTLRPESAAPVAQKAQLSPDANDSVKKLQELNAAWARRLRGRKL